MGSHSTSYVDMSAQWVVDGDVVLASHRSPYSFHHTDTIIHPGMDKITLSNLYRITPFKERRAEHLSAIMYRLSKDKRYLETSRPEIHLQNRNKIKFRVHHRVHEKYLKSPISRGITMWDQIPESVQKSTTKVKFQRDLKPYLVDLLRPLLR